MVHFVAAERPAVYSEVSRRVPPHELARAQGIVQMTLMVAQTLGVLGGWLLTGSVVATFVSVTAACVMSMGAIGFLSPPRRPEEEAQ